MINEKTLLKLEYGAILQQISLRARSESARREILATLPYSKIEDIDKAVLLTGEAIEYVNNAILPDFSFDDMSSVLDKARIRSTLSMRDLLGIMRLLRTSRLLKDNIVRFNTDKVQMLIEIGQKIYDNKSFEDNIDFCILAEDQMNDKASEKLFSIRQKIKRVNADIREKLQKYTRSKELAGFLQDSIVTLREGRYVVPVKTEFKNMVKGLVHDQSASGSTVFIEPLAIVNLNNDLKMLTLEESNEVERILQDFTVSVGNIVKELQHNQRLIVQLDTVFCRALYAIDTKSVCPVINGKGYVNLIKARHPLLNKDNAVPISVSFGKDYNVVVITGPNTGGKTVSLKTVGLLCLMAYTGLYIPAQDGSEVAVFDNIFVDVGDEQSIEQSLSTFSSHIVSIKYVTEHVTQKSLVLLDEVCAGTEPNEGSALALAITQFLLDCKCRAIITTHYSQLKEFSLLNNGVENASMEFNPETFAPTYKLIMGIPGSSNAIEIARRLGLSEMIISTARSNVSAEKTSFESVLHKAEMVRQENEREKEDVIKMKQELQEKLDKANRQNEILLAEREKLLKKSQQEVRQIINSAQQEAEELVNQIKEILNAPEIEQKALFEARSITKKLSDKKYTSGKIEEEDNIFVGDPVDLSTLKIGDTVYVKSLNSVATVNSIDKKGRITVRCGKMTISVKNEDLFMGLVAGKTKEEKERGAAHTKIHSEAVSNEINLLGQTVDEAIANVDAFIDSSLIHGLSQIRVIHGFGTGKLRTGLHRHFAKHPNVAEYRLGVYGEGEGGVTIVKFK